MCRHMYIQTMDPSAHHNLAFDPLDPTKVSCLRDLSSAHCTLHPFYIHVVGFLCQSKGY